MKYGPFRAVLTAQARYLAPIIAVAAVATALLPLLTLQGGAPSGVEAADNRIAFLLGRSTDFGAFYPAIATALGILFAAANWLPDATGRWVYAFTLPVSRSRLAALRLGTGALLMLPAMLSLWIVGAVGAAVSELPPVIRAHPGALALRFAAATLVVYAAASVVALLGRRVWYLAALILALFVLDAFGVALLQSVLEALFLHPLSPFHALAGYWLYLDV